MKKWLLASSTILAALIYLSTYYVDYEILSFFITRKIQGKSTESCLDLPERLWVRIPKCHPEYAELMELERLKKEAAERKLEGEAK